MRDEFKEISIRGRLAFGAIALENAFLKENIKGGEVITLMDRIWKFTSSAYLDEWEGTIDEVTPCVILDEKDSLHGYKSLGYDEAVRLRNFYKHIPSYLCDIADYVIAIGTDNIYGGTGKYSEATLEPTVKLLELCIQNKVPLPPIEIFKRFSYDVDNGWGKCFDRNEVVMGLVG